MRDTSNAELRQGILHKKHKFGPIVHVSYNPTNNSKRFVCDASVELFWVNKIPTKIQSGN